jgi:hypothetical protein
LSGVRFVHYQEHRDAQARQTLQELRSLSNIEKYLKSARAELASNPCDDRLSAFIVAVESLLLQEKDKLEQLSQASVA